jgi:hypothetical protein
MGSASIDIIYYRFSRFGICMQCFFWLLMVLLPSLGRFRRPPPPAAASLMGSSPGIHLVAQSLRHRVIPSVRIVQYKFGRCLVVLHYLSFFILIPPQLAST